MNVESMKKLESRVFEKNLKSIKCIYDSESFYNK